MQEAAPCAEARGRRQVALLDLVFPALFLAVVAREIIAGRNWRNLPMLAGIGVLIVGNITFHWEAIHDGSAAYGTRLGIAAVIALAIAIGKN